MSEIDVYPHELWVRVKLEEWKRWTRGEGQTLALASTKLWDHEAGEARELNRSDFHVHTFSDDAGRTDLALQELRLQSHKQHGALQHYHFKSWAHRAIAKVVKVHHMEVDELLRHAHENFVVIRKEISINTKPVLA